MSKPKNNDRYQITTSTISLNVNAEFNDLFLKEENEKVDE